MLLRKLTLLCFLGVLSASAVDLFAVSFPHGKDKHKTVECGKCHTITASQPDVRAFPGHLACVGCHNFAAEALKKPAAYCTVCHDGRPVSKTAAALFQFPKRDGPTEFGTQLSHPAHLRPQSGDFQGLFGNYANSPGQPPTRVARCSDCHNLIVNASASMPDQTRETGHSACFRCHGERPVKGPTMYQCAECHKLAEPRSPHLFGIVQNFRHPDHRYDIRPKKKRDLPLKKGPDYLCVECHSSAAAAERLGDIKLPEANYCQLCHNGWLGLPDPLTAQVLESLNKR